MHATMIAAWPAVLYWQPETLVCLHQVQQARADGLQVYATLDAGPNVKLIFLVQEQPQIQALFPGLQVVDPFAASPRP
jgi:diphosphomevalonate decarboxylase